MGKVVWQGLSPDTEPAEYMIVGTFAKFGSKFYINLQMVNVSTACIESSSRIGATDYDGLVGEIDLGIEALFGVGTGAAPKRLSLNNTNAAEPDASGRPPSPTPPDKPQSGLAPPGFALVEAGTFQMGSTEGENWEKPAHPITISRSVWMSETEVTFDQYERFKPAADSTFFGARRSVKGTRPVFNVSWYEAVSYCNWLSDQEGLNPAYTGSIDTGFRCDFTADGYRLPTEAEWEFAARGGTKAQETKFSGSNSIDEVAWYDGNRVNRKGVFGFRTEYLGPMPVAQMQPNELGLYDMSGNVGEWCWDHLVETYYDDSPSVDPAGPTNLNSRFRDRVVRGGCWLSFSKRCSVFSRDGAVATTRNGSIGFRLVRTIPAFP